MYIYSVRLCECNYMTVTINAENQEIENRIYSDTFLLPYLRRNIIGVILSRGIKFGLSYKGNLFYVEVNNLSVYLYR